MAMFNSPEQLLEFLNGADAYLSERPRTVEDIRRDIEEAQADVREAMLVKNELNERNARGIVKIYQLALKINEGEVPLGAFKGEDGKYRFPDWSADRKAIDKLIANDLETE